MRAKRRMPAAVALVTVRLVPDHPTARPVGLLGSLVVALSLLATVMRIRWRERWPVA